MVANPGRTRRSVHGRFAPIETYYTSRRFERRLHARWAVFLDTLRVGQRYYDSTKSPETGPIFLLTSFEDYWLVVQPRVLRPYGVRRLRQYVINGSAREVAILFGRSCPPWVTKTYGGIAWWRNELGQTGEDMWIRWQECIWCEQFCLVPAGARCPSCGQSEHLSDSTKRLVKAYQLAASIRFPAPVPT